MIKNSVSLVSPVSTVSFRSDILFALMGSTASKFAMRAKTDELGRGTNRGGCVRAEESAQERPEPTRNVVWNQYNSFLTAPLRIGVENRDGGSQMRTSEESGEGVGNKPGMWLRISAVASSPLYQGLGFESQL